jgi:hypothetical protein
MTNVKGRLAEAYTCSTSCATKITDEGFDYTVVGQPNDIYESTPNSGGFYRVNMSYHPNGSVATISDLVGLPTLTYGVDGEGRIYSTAASTGQNPLVSTTYNFASLPTQINLGSTDSDSFTYDPNTNRISQFKFSVNGKSVVGSLTWNPIGTLEDLNVSDPFFWVGTKVVRMFTTT